MTASCGLTVIYAYGCRVLRGGSAVRHRTLHQKFVTVGVPLITPLSDRLRLVGSARSKPTRYGAVPPMAVSVPV